MPEPNGDNKQAMKPSHDIEERAYTMGKEAVGQALAHAEELCLHERRRRDKLNAAEEARLNGHGSWLSERRKELLAVLRLVPTGDLSALKRTRWNYRILASLFFAGGVFSTMITLSPFGFGWSVWPMSVAIAALLAFMTGRALELWGGNKFVYAALIVIGFLGSLGVVVVLGALRADIFAMHFMKIITGGSLSDMSSTSAISAGKNFYEAAIPWLKFLMMLVGPIMEVATGIALHKARALNVAAAERAERARRELLEVEEEMSIIMGKIHLLRADAEVFEATFKRNFILGLYDGVKRNGLIRLGAILLLLLSFAPVVWAGEQPLNVVVAIDLSQSVAVSGYDGKTDFKKNLDAAAQLVFELPKGSRYRIVGITDQSFSRPFLLLDRTLPDTSGDLEFLDQVVLAKDQIAAEVRRLRDSLQPKFPLTDIFGAILVGADLLGQGKHDRKVLILLSDMRHSTREIDLERPGRIDVPSALARVKRLGLIADLRGIEIYALGVDAAGKQVAYWQSLRRFWTEYSGLTKGELKVFAQNRELVLR